MARRVRARQRYAQIAVLSVVANCIVYKVLYKSGPIDFKGAADPKHDDPIALKQP